MMSEIPVQLFGPNGELLGKMRQGAMAIIAEAEQAALARNLSKRTALSVTLRECLAQSGFAISDTELASVANTLDTARRGEKLLGIQVIVSTIAPFYNQPDL